jgi:hypothetical protein
VESAVRDLGESVPWLGHVKMAMVATQVATRARPGARALSRELRRDAEERAAHRRCGPLP